MGEAILTDRGEGVLTITLNRPQVLNAFNDVMTGELQEAFRQAERDPQTRCLVITGAGRGFCSGQDLKDQAAREVSFQEVIRRRYNPIILRLQTMEKPVIAGVNGVAAGAGFSLVLACDLRIASEQASFIQVFSRVGLIKRAVAHALSTDLEGALDYEAYLQEVAGRTADHKEGVQAFLEKRPPRFSGR